ncbi:MAG: c-type cytochrome [Elusimicrobia bacterium]|nr:c-type cytochrome [Elusimicrobiota bacterium]
METLILLAALASAATTQAPVEESSAARGERLYARTCAVCHGPKGEGYKADNAPAIGAPGYLASVTDSFLHRAIAEGRPGTTMSAWSAARTGPLSTQDIEAVLSYLRTFDTAEHPVLDESALSGDSLRGKTLFAANCQKCHGSEGRGGDAVAIGGPELLADSSNGMLRHAIKEGRGKFMPSFAGELKPQGVEDVVAFLRVLQSSHTAKEPQLASPAPPLPLGGCPKTGPEPVGFSTFPAVVSVELVKSQFNLGAKMCLLDSRAQSDYLTEHIKGAVSVPFYDPEPYLAALPKDTWLVCYCACPHAESMHLAKKLIGAGFTKVTVLDEGILHWKGKKYPVRRGPDP